MSKSEKEVNSLPEVVCLVFYNRRMNTVLLEQRLDDDAFYGHWTFTGGKVEEGESLEQASIREAGEETGLTPLYNTQCFINFNGVSRNGNPYVFHGILIINWSGKLENKEGEKKRKLRWMPLEKVREYIGDTEVDRQVYEAFLSHIKRE